MKLVIAIGFISLLIVFAFLFGPRVKTSLFPKKVSFNAAEGTCSLLHNQCQEADDGCLAICTDNQRQYEGKRTTNICIKPLAPVGGGYACGCVFAQSKCGWMK